MTFGIPQRTQCGRTAGRQLARWYPSPDELKNSTYITPEPIWLGIASSMSFPSVLRRIWKELILIAFVVPNRVLVPFCSVLLRSYQTSPDNRIAWQWPRKRMGSSSREPISIHNDLNRRFWSSCIPFRPIVFRVNIELDRRGPCELYIFWDGNIPEYSQPSLISINSIPRTLYIRPQSMSTR